MMNQNETTVENRIVLQPERHYMSWIFIPPLLEAPPAWLVSFFLALIVLLLLIIIVLIIQIHKKNRLQHQLFQSEYRFRSFFESMNEAVALHRVVYNDRNEALDYQLLDINPAYSRIIGFSREQAVNALASRLYGTNTPPYIDIFSQVVASGEPKQMEIYFPPLDKFFLVSTIATGSGEFATLTLDLTARVRAEKLLKEKTDELERIFNLMTDMVCVVDLEGIFLKVNPQFERALGFKAEEMVGHNFFEFIHPDDIRDSREALAQLSQESPNINFINRYRSKDGKWHYLEWFSRTHGSLLYAVAHDVTERLLTENKRELLVNELKQKNQELESLFNVISHDLRSPLINILGFSQILEQTMDEFFQLLTKSLPSLEIPHELNKMVKEELPRTVDFITSNVTRMDRMLSAILRLSRTGQIVLNSTLLDMNELVTTALDSLSFLQHQVNAEIEISPLPAANGDKILLSQVISNILENAMKYRDTERSLKITVSGSIQGEKVTIIFRDNGIGIDSPQIDKIWEIFNRAVSDSNIPGDGIGLTICRWIIHRHGGRIWVESEPGKGSCFCFELPLNKNEYE